MLNSDCSIACTEVVFVVNLLLKMLDLTKPRTSSSRTYKQLSNFAFSRQVLNYFNFCFDLHAVGRQLALGIVHQAIVSTMIRQMKITCPCKLNPFVPDNRTDLFSSPDTPGKYSMYVYTLFSLSSAWVLDFLAAGKSGESHCTGKQSALSKSYRITTKFVKLLPAKVLAP